MMHHAPIDDVLPLDNLQRGLDAWQRAVAQVHPSRRELEATVARLVRELAQCRDAAARDARLLALGRSVGRIARRLSESLEPMGMYLRWLRRTLPKNDGDPILFDRLTTHLACWDGSLSDLFVLADAPLMHTRRVMLVDLLQDVLHLVEPWTTENHVNVRIDVPATLSVSGDRALLRQAVFNLVRNALEAMPHGGEIVATSYIGDGWLELEIADSGPGLFDEVRHRAFEPFFSAKAANLGLGLAVVEQIAELHGGRVATTNCPEGGAAFTLRLPTPRRATAAA
ncbi:MAG TPA: ATP-binding protein [Pirellulales bacterium]